MRKTNFLIGKGEQLTSPINAPRKCPQKKAAVYSFFEAKDILLPQFQAASYELDQLPNSACPDDYGVLRMVIHPQYLAKSYYPSDFMATVNLIHIGSKTKTVTPRKTTNNKLRDTLCATTELYVAGKRAVIRDISAKVKNMSEGSVSATQFAQIEQAGLYQASTSIISNEKQEDYFEVAIHLLPNSNSNLILYHFYNYVKQLGFKIFDDLSFQTGLLYFTPIFGPVNMIDKLKQFVFIRMVRNVPPLRSIIPHLRVNGAVSSCQLPVTDPLSSLPSVAILDGGLPEEHLASKWVNSYKKMDPEVKDDEGATLHGLSVTSAFLFGPIDPQKPVAKPFSYVDHIRILDKKIEQEDPLELYRTLGFIEEILLSRQYEFINLSLGPNLPIENDDIHAWTAVIDKHLSDGQTLMTIAAGNNGENDQTSGNARVQVPGDCINAITVGSATTINNEWERASYSALGPGRRPGIVKPDAVAFGGSASHYFHVLTQGMKPNISPTMGTSFASPYMLRNAVGIKAILGNDVTPLVIKALLIHTAQNSNNHKHVGWGKVPDDITDIITCSDGVARIVYKGSLVPGKYIQAKLPIPKGLQGKCKIKATFCYASNTDPQDAGLYTKAGLNITFRPNITKHKGPQVADTKSFFSYKPYATESELIKELGKWENVLHNENTYQCLTLNEPVFDIHYTARGSGAPTSSADDIPYALVLTIEVLRHPNIFNEILSEYPLLAEI